MIVNFIVALIMVIITVFIWNKWNSDTIEYKSVRTIFIILIASFLVLINYFSINSFIKVVNTLLLFIIVHKILFKCSLKKSISSALIIELIYIISETIYSLIVLSILKNKSSDFVNNYFGSVLSNLSISFIVIVLSKFNFSFNLKKKLDKFFNNIDDIIVLFLSCIVVLIYTFFAVNAYYHIESNLLISISLLIMILIIILMIIFIKTKEDYYNVCENYNNSLISLKELEKVLTNNRIDNHENKNHLLTIRNMTKNKKVIGFIDTILNNKIEDDKRIAQETSIIPSGGLRGLIYSKILLMNNKNIDYELDVASSVRVVDILDYSDSMMLDICKIIGIFLDNAIEEMANVEDKYIVIEMYKDEDVFKISITNTYDNTIDKSDIYKSGVSTKGGNHGYGLSLVKKIVNNNSNFKTNTEISEEEFTQILEIYK